ncbi:hypothetical protein VZT92_013877 [Zoarces viviparus]|uniref:Uncharacterized protein n=1 Tax=Zoarces viviparus TaxID=48416 RepID=A0AAW1EWZ0_ZOAVI
MLGSARLRTPFPPVLLMRSGAGSPSALLLLLLLLVTAHSPSNRLSGPVATAAEPCKPCYRAGERQQRWCCGAELLLACSSPPAVGTG